MFRLNVAGFLFLGIALAASAGPLDDLIERDQQRLEGTWKVIAVEAEGTPIPAREFRDLQLTFKDGKFTARRGDEEPQVGAYTINPGKNPREMDIDRTDGPAKGQKQVAVYSLAGNILKICSCEADNPRPKGFDTRDKPGHTLMTLRRVQQGGR
jgi:uncharacterized protein (TIGR03067 family)